MHNWVPKCTQFSISANMMQLFSSLLYSSVCSHTLQYYDVPPASYEAALTPTGHEDKHQATDTPAHTKGSKQARVPLPPDTFGSGRYPDLHRLIWTLGIVLRVTPNLQK